MIENDKLKQFIEQVINQKLESMDNMAVPNHAHNGYDVNQIDPAIGLSGFPVVQVSSATAAPSDTPVNGTFRFQVDTSPKYAFWAYLNYNNGGTITGAWKSIQLT